jgi:potassium efflux system protein
MNRRRIRSTSVTGSWLPLVRFLLLLAIASALPMAQAQLAVSPTGTPRLTAPAEPKPGSGEVVSQVAELQAQAARFIQQAKESRDATDRFAEAVRSAPDATKQLEKELARPLIEPVPADTARAKLGDLVEQLQRATTALDALRQSRSNLEAESAQRFDRRQQLGAEVARYRDRLYEVTGTLAAPGDSQQSGDLADAQRAALEAERKFLEQKLLELEQESRGFDAQRELWRLRKQLAERDVLEAERRLDALTNAVVSARALENEQTRRTAEQQVLASADAPAPVRAIAEENAAMTRELSTISERVRSYSADKQNIEDLFAKTSKAFDAARERIARAGLTATAGLHLRTLRSQLPDLRYHGRRIVERRDEMSRVQLRRLALEDMQIALVDLNRAAEQRVAADPTIAAESQPNVVAAVKTGLERQKSQYLPELLRAYDAYVDLVLTPLDERERQLVDLAERFSNFIGERILWVQSSPPMSWDSIVRSWEAVFWLLDPVAWSALLAALWWDFGNSFPLYALAAALFVAMLVLELRLRALLRHYDELAGLKFRARFSHTLAVVFLGFVLSLTWPLLLAFCGSRMQLLPGLQLAVAVGDGLIWCAVVLLFANLLLAVFRRGSLAEVHFGWDPDNCRLVRNTIRWALPMAMPLSFLVASTDLQPLESYRDSLGRLAFAGAMLVAAVFLYRVFRPEKGVFKNWLRQDPSGWLSRLRYLWFGAMLLVPAALLIASEAGYFYTAVQLERKVLFTGLFLMALTVARELMLRWVDLAQRQLALERARARLAARLQAGKEDATRSGRADDQTPATGAADALIEESAIDVDAVSAQTEKLVNGLALLATLFGMALIWRDVLPAVGMLSEITLWSDVVTTVTKDSGGGVQTVQQLMPVTLENLFISVLVVVVAVIVSRNIPGLLEIAVLQHLPITPGSRYAVTTLVRYALLMIGIFIAFGAVGISWSKVQWLVAAMTVGLAFGLQEIFANFVSGLIILFERPVRVGDLVTIGNISGTVSRIRMRATTITDWDRKELIIPNKELVTGQVVNWSLSDNILRVPIRIGVAYGSDTVLVTQLLLEAAKSHPVVLRDPTPTAFFTEFGGSSLHFELRIFVPSADDLFPVRHDLLQKIDKVFAAHGIEIAFPQRDLHLRSVAPEVVEAMGGLAGSFAATGAGGAAKA